MFGRHYGHAGVSVPAHGRSAGRRAIMLRKIDLKLVVVLSLIAVCAPSAFPQATFNVGSAAVTAADIGVTELTGTIQLSVASGTTAAAPIQISYSAHITNNSANEIFITGNGPLANVPLHPTLPDLHTILIPVPAGGGPGNVLQIAGVRVALAGYDFTTVTATVSSPSGGNGFTAGQNVVTVINEIQSPFSVDVSQQPILSWKNGKVINGKSSISILEEYPAAFSSNTGTYGQTVVTQFRVEPYPPLPDGASITFPGTVASMEVTGSLLRTIDSNPVTVPRNDGTSDVTYYFQAGVGSDQATETFPIQVAFALASDSTSTGVATFQATLLPIGIEEPNKQSPSTAIPRYFERTLPADEDLQTGSTTLAFPFRKASDHMYTGIAITNIQSFAAGAELTAYDSTGKAISGTGITNPVTIDLPANGQFAKLATEIFGTGFNAAGPGMIIAQGRTSLMQGFYLIGDETGSAVDGATADITTLQGWLWPVVYHQGPAASNILEIYNPGSDSAKVTTTLYDQSGAQKASVQLAAIPPGGSTAQDLTQIFSAVNLNSFSGGYVTTRSDESVMGRETFGNQLDNNVVLGQTATQKTSIPVAHFAQGGGYVTELNLVSFFNAANANVTVTALDNSGAPLLIAGNPVQLSIPPATQVNRSLQDYFPALPASLTTGSLRLDVEPIVKGPFTTTPNIYGSIRFASADGYASAALPVFMPPVSDFVYSHIAQSQGWYTGVAFLNANTSSATVTLTAYEADGTVVGTSTTTLAAGQRISKLLRELIPATAGQVGGWVKVHSSKPIVSFALFGTDNGQSLSAIPPQIID